MAEFSGISSEHEAFIAGQKIFFVGTAAPEGRVNIAVKDMASLSVIGPNRILWLNLTGAENETAAHLLESKRMTIMWCSFEKRPLVLRAYGSAEVVHLADEEWDVCAEVIAPAPGARQYVNLAVDFVLTSCGFGVPLYAFNGHRDTLRRWAIGRGDDGLREHWAEYNAVSLDGKPTRITA
ncbi:MAG: pyridoxamine 5'-phosphate oxidase family protein [Paracoccaceae bacterium]|nr:pyridoxamine 5'-phosphate oxidase family protein [Paracoccaceae bacterium]